MDLSHDARVLSFNPGHDGGIALVSGGKLIFSIESEKDNGRRHGDATPMTVLRALSASDMPPNFLAIGGWAKGASPLGEAVAAGYRGLAPVKQVDSIRIMGRDIDVYSSSHERSHLYCAYGMSPFEQGQPCYGLVWEGHIGAFYEFDEKAGVSKLADILNDPGIRFAFLYALADPSFPLPDVPGAIRLGDAGKLMALAGFASGKVGVEGQELTALLLRPELQAHELRKSQFVSNKFYNCGVEDQEFKNLVKHFSDALFNAFLRQVSELINRPAPLLISGGCGLNCDWNSRWRSSGLFTDLFVPPCANDSGSSVGTAIDVQRHLSGKAKISWDVYSGESPICDAIPECDFKELGFTPGFVAELLKRGAVIAWVKGRYEMGPRALGARSILASPLNRSMEARLNGIKKRESFRPIAPVCMEEEVDEYFSPGGVLPYMLEFRKVISHRIPAVTHVDRTARPQSVNGVQNPGLYAVLTEFRRLTGCGVLCNTSLNYPGYGFLNRRSDVAKFCTSSGLDAFVFEDELYVDRKFV